MNKRSWKQTGKRRGEGAGAWREGGGEPEAGRLGDLEGSLGNRNPVRRPRVWPESILPFTFNEARAATAWKPGYCEAEAGMGAPPGGPCCYLRVSGSWAWGRSWGCCGCCWVLREGPAEWLWG